MVKGTSRVFFLPIQIIYGKDSIVIHSLQLDSTIDRDPTRESRFGTPS